MGEMNPGYLATPVILAWRGKKEAFCLHELLIISRLLSMNRALYTFVFSVNCWFSLAFLYTYHPFKLFVGGVSLYVNG